MYSRYICLALRHLFADKEPTILFVFTGDS